MSGADARERRGLQRNIPLFVAFRILFNARFYYPVFAILFLDLGLSLEEFALANVVWAVAIVVLEVPSGAIADRIGRRNMVRLASALMVAEMLLIALVPTGAHALVLGAILLNRLLSGAAEASASGADEALAYDSLCLLGRRDDWPKLLARLMRWQSLAFFASSMIGAACYDPAFINSAFGLCGVETAFDQQDTMRLPIFLTLALALGAVGASWLMHEPDNPAADGGRVTLAGTWRQVVDAWRWFLATPAAIVLLAAAFLYDSAVRLYLTIGSSYYRLIEIPESAYGLIGSSFALLGLATAPLGRALVARAGALRNLALPAALIVIGLGGTALAIPYWGVVFMLPLGVAFFLTMFFTSHYLNQWVDTRQRATVLSFRGLALNLAYGAIGLAFSGLVALIRKHADASISETAALGHALPWVAGYFALAAPAFWLAARVFLRRSGRAAD